MRGKVGVNSLAVDPQRPHLFVTGGTDPLGAGRTANPLLEIKLEGIHGEVHHPACTALAQGGQDEVRCIP